MSAINAQLWRPVRDQHTLKFHVGRGDSAIAEMDLLLSPSGRPRLFKSYLRALAAAKSENRQLAPTREDVGAARNTPAMRLRAEEKKADQAVARADVLERSHRDLLHAINVMVTTFGTHTDPAARHALQVAKAAANVGLNLKVAS